jgi:hypothetical protein
MTPHNGSWLRLTILFKGGTSHLPDVIIERLSKPSVNLEESTSEAIKPYLMVIDEPNEEPAYDWLQPNRMFLENHLPSGDNAKVEHIARKFKQYHLIDRVLFRRGVSGMMMKCISRAEGIQLLRDIHSGICGSHSSWHSIIGKTFRHGFYKPTAKDDAMEIITKCRDC